MADVDRRSPQLIGPLIGPRPIVNPRGMEANSGRSSLDDFNELVNVTFATDRFDAKKGMVEARSAA